MVMTRWSRPGAGVEPGGGCHCQQEIIVCHNKIHHNDLPRGSPGPRGIFVSNVKNLLPAAFLPTNKK